jgi:hemerythrin-like metal-binding protein
VQAEHEIQLKLLNVLRQALARPEPDRARCGVLIRQLLDYSEAHFLSEQLLMRQIAYPGYEQHVQQHDLLLAELRGLAEAWEEAGGSGAGAAAELARQLEEWLLVHMRTADHSLTLYVTELGGAAR